MRGSGIDKIKCIITVSDLHCGCKLGLCPTDGISLDDGGEYKPSKLQRAVWSYWEEFWKEWVPMVTEGEPFCVVVNGDSIDGNHHNSTTQISHSLLDQRRVAEKVLAPVVKQCGGRYYHIRGTEAHAGKSGVDEEDLAKSLGAIPDKDGKHARYELWKKLGHHLVHHLHHIGTTSSSAHEASAINAELTASFTEAARWSEKIPTVVIRSHRHRNSEVRIPTAYGYATAVCTPGWQLKTPFTWRMAGARLAPPQFGGVMTRIDKYGEAYTKSYVKTIQRDDAE